MAAYKSLALYLEYLKDSTRHQVCIAFVISPWMGLFDGGGFGLVD